MSQLSKPALAGLWPNKNGMNVVLDLGANIECNEENLVEFAELGSALYKSLYPNDKPLVTNREMDITKLDFNHLNVQGQKDGGYVSNEYQPIENQRASTNYNDFGVVGAKQGEGNKLYDSAYRQTFKNNKQHIERTNMGNMKLFNPYLNATVKDGEIENNRQNAIYDPSVYTPNQQLLGTNEKNRQNYVNNNENRMDSNLLQAFKNNPYTQPLGSVA